MSDYLAHIVSVGIVIAKGRRKKEEGLSYLEEKGNAGKINGFSN
ncbi:hypothetical protein [Kamptonema sp. UHCC 0994]|nr:hypothetical protein [Kamptonema sp. UHCC 0994]MDF0553931.1 hypothetical protein [Kamptonema sp. UHCC 0994]